jgi:hypothetical protein
MYEISESLSVVEISSSKAVERSCGEIPPSTSKAWHSQMRQQGKAHRRSAIKISTT